MVCSLHVCGLKMFTHFLSFSHGPAACPVHIVFLRVVTHITFGEKYKLWSSSLCNFHHPLIILYLLSPNVLLQAQWQTIFLSREGTPIASIPTYPPQTSNARNPTASRTAEMVSSMVGQFSQPARVTLSKPSFTVAVIRPLRDECFLFVQVWLRKRTMNRTVVDALHMAYVKRG